MSCWYYHNEEFTQEMANGYYGFVYLITNLLSGRKYIGRKYFTKKLTKKALAGQKKKRKIISESNWQNYFGSCDVLLEDIAIYTADNFKREILSLHKTRGEVNYTEVKEQFNRDVLYSVLPDGRKEYYNSNIMCRYFAPKKH